MNTPIGRAEVRCLNCGNWMPSMISLGSKELFEKALVSGNQQQCPRCGAMTPCNKENMRWVQSDGKGGFVGNDTVV